MNSNVIYDIKDVHKSYGHQKTEVLRGIDLSIQEGEFVALMGPSGCGKSTLLNLLGTLDHSTSGNILFKGKSVGSLTETEQTQFRKKNIGFIFQFFNLLSTLTVAENIALPLELENVLNDKEISTKVDEILNQVGLSHRKDYYPALLSGGEMQRVAIARAIIHKPGIILADEPTGNLDTETGKSILELLSSLSKEHQLTIFMATHSQEAAEYADRIIHIRDGKLVY